MATRFHTKHIRGQKIAYLEEGEGPLVICLHGFPDSAHSFDELRRPLVEQGYRVVAPWLRGYYPSGPAADGDYSVATLSDDILHLIEHLGEDKAALVGHDWGGLAAYCAANQSPEKIEKLVVLGVPHLYKVNPSVKQIFNSWYVWLFQIPFLPEYLLERNHYQMVDQLYHLWSPNWDVDEMSLKATKDSLSGHGGPKHAITFYRKLMRGFSRRSLKLLTQQTSTSSLWFCGREDGSLHMNQFEGIEEAFTGEFELVALDHVGHFIHREAPDLVNDRVMAFLDS